MGSPHKIIKEYLDGADNGNQHGYIADLLVPAQIGEQDQHDGCTVDQHRLGTAERVAMQRERKYLKRIVDRDPHHEETANQTGKKEQYCASVVVIKMGEK